MKAELFQVPTELPETLLPCSASRRVTHVPLEGANELFFTRVGSDADYDGLRMIRFGARFVVRQRLIGVAYGLVFHVRPGWAPPEAEEFYDWCDSTTAEIAQLVRWILDSGRFDELFATGDALAVDAFEFLPETPSATQRALLREVATALKRRYRQLSRTAVVVHPHHFGEPPRIDSGSRRVRAYRRALDTVMQMAQELRLGERLRPQKPTEDLLIGRDPSIDFEGELLELVPRAGLHRQL